MNRFLLKQSLILPLGAMLVPMLMGFTISGYSSLSQQLSELELLHHPAAQATRIAAIVCGASIILFSLALMQRGLRQYLFTSFSALIFGASMVSNGIFVMGSPLHGLYGIGFFVVLVPAFFAAEFTPTAHSTTVRTISMAIAVYNLLYIWLMITRLDPMGFHGLTQRISIFFWFGWYSFASYALLHSTNAASATEPGTAHSLSTQPRLS
ncbi:DUF998 domain-containing protein [Granulicella sp. L60]|uniref:DUF998 domain-containing protein n=1 Tax=Granulicella sp. L60 TaxID=1641866 RepID=UPI00131E1CE8|nr:DUF998 domain-containing protein [Granulicella sp. L60]